MGALPAPDRRPLTHSSSYSEDVLATIEEPTLVITGDRDEVADLGQAERLLSAIPGAELAIVPGRRPRRSRPDPLLGSGARLPRPPAPVVDRSPSRVDRGLRVLDHLRGPPLGLRNGPVRAGSSASAEIRSEEVPRGSLPAGPGPRADTVVCLWITSQYGSWGPRLPPTSRVGLPTGIQQKAKAQVSGPNRVNSVLSFRFAPW